MVRSGRALAAVASFALGTAPGIARASSASELVREARAHEAAREDDLALRRYTEALALDPTLGDAYLGLGAVRLRLGDAREAIRVYDAALTYVPGLARAWLGRGRAERALGALREADVDLEAYISVTDDEQAMHQLGEWYGEEGRPLAQLGVWRRILAAAERQGDAASLREARLTVHALEVIVTTADPVRTPPGDAQASAVRRGLARIEARR